MQQKHLEELLNVDLEEFNKREGIYGHNYLPRSESEDTNKTIFMYIKDNSLLKQANYFLEKEKKNLENEIDKISEKCEKLEALNRELESKIKEQDLELSQYKYGESQGCNKTDFPENRLNMSVPYALNYTIKHQKEENFRMSRNDLKSLATLIKDTQSKRRGRTNTTRSEEQRDF